MRGFGMDFATPQTLAKIQDEQAERERARRVKEANLAAYDAARRDERSRSGGSVSATEIGPDGRITSFSNTTIGPDGSVQREGFGDAWNLQGQVGSEFADLARRSAMAQKHNARLGTDSLSAAMRAAMANGGRLPQNLVGLLSRNLGMDGNNQSVFSAGFLNNGDFDIDIVTRGANGGLQRTTRRITPQEQYDLVNSTPGVWGSDGLAVSQRLYNGLRNTMGKSELAPPSVYANNLRQYNTQKQSADTIKMMTGLYQAVYKDMSKGGKQPVTTDMIRARMVADMLKNPKVGPQITSVPDLNEDGTQKMVEDENGQQVPAMRQADSNNPDDVERVKQNLKMRLDLVPELAPRQDVQGGGEADRRLAFLKYIYDRENPPTPPDVLAFQQGQRERQMRQVEEAQAREDVTRRPQQVINYFKDGRWYSGNGYIRDGKVYDGQGYEIEGATPAEMARGADGGVYSNENGWVARALPSARELVGGRGGAEAQNGGAQGGGVNWTPGHDLRNDGKTYKGTGWLGVLRLPNGGVASEYTVGVEIGGKEIDIPTLVPTLTKEEQDLMVNDIIPNNKDVPDSILKKAVDFAKMRLANGRSVFANDGTPQQAQQPAQGAQQAAAQGSTASATSDIDAKKKQLATMEAELERRQFVGKMVDDIVSERNAALDGPRVGKSTGNDFAPIGYGGINVNMDLKNNPPNEKELDESLRQKELATVKEISSRGGEVWHDEDSRLHARIGNFEYLPRDEQEKYRDGIVSGLPLDVIRDIQRRAYVAKKNVAENREKNLAMLRSKARGMFQTEAERVKYVSDEDKKWRRKNDPGYKDADSASNTEKTAEANLFAFFP